MNSDLCHSFFQDDTIETENISDGSQDHIQCDMNQESVPDSDDCGRKLRSNKKSSKSKARSNSNIDEGLFSCDYCERSFTKTSSLMKHIRYSHSYEKHICEYCRKVFKTSWNLRNHIRIHTDERPFGCDYCKKAFNDPSNLKRHIRIHTNKYPYSCKFCPQGFKENSSLQSHLLFHTNERPLYLLI